MIWKDVVGYEGIYEVSDTGLVRTHEDKTTCTTRHGIRKWKQRVLKQKVTKDNSHRVSLYKDGKEKTWSVHRIVALAFIPQVEGKEYINHIDGSRHNNHVTNLEWCNHKENNNHAFDTGLISTSVLVNLIDKETGTTHEFRSMAKASVFMGRCHNYLSYAKKKGKTENEDYRYEFIERKKAK